MSEAAAIARWWTRQHVDRDFSDLEWAFLGDAALMLDDLAPRQVDPALCAVASAGRDGLLVLIPHRSLAGLCLVTTVTPQFVTVSWASVTDLAAHDDLDLSREVYLYGRDDSDDGMLQAAVAGLREQLGRSFVLRMRSTREGVPVSAACYLAGADGTLRRIAKLPPRGRPFERYWPWSVRSDRPISFVDVTPPPYAVPSRAAAWFRADHRLRKQEPRP